MAAVSSLRYLWAYSAADEWTLNWHRRLLRRRQEQGFDVEHFCVTPASLNHRWLPFSELDQRWRNNDPALLHMYESLARRLQGRDVLILYNGANLHPEFVSSLKQVLRVYTAGDDPESTEILTKPIAPAFNIHLVNNIACVDMYRQWGLKQVYFWPLGSQTFVEDTTDLDEQHIGELRLRSLPLVFLGERLSYRNQRLDRLAETFPQAFFAGRGWPRGFIDYSDMWQVYRQAQIGWNLHNSSGPINFRVYELPAHGVMQICDNKAFLGQIFELGREVIGFDSIEECIELTDYYLEHPDEQREIAIAGWKRYRRDYTPDRVWDRLVEIVETHWSDFAPTPPVLYELPIGVRLQVRRRKVEFAQLMLRIHRWLRRGKQFVKRVFHHLRQL